MLVFLASGDLLILSLGVITTPVTRNASGAAAVWDALAFKNAGAEIETAGNNHPSKGNARAV